jgi:hypothetical protein
MAQCPAGHDSASADYCDLCGLRMDGPVTKHKAPEEFGELAPTHEPARPSTPCPRCGTPGLGRFCEACGYTAAADSVRLLASAEDIAPAQTVIAEEHLAPQVAVWTAVVTANRAHYDAVMANAATGASVVSFPANCPRRTFPLAGSRIRIGRRSLSKEVVPEIDLTGPPADPGISRLHAIFVSQPDGGWAVIDPGSENGVTVNEHEISPGQPVLLRHGDVIFIGAWTSIAIVAPGDSLGEPNV